MNDTLLDLLGDTVVSLVPHLVEVRRDLHAHPELSREETRSTALIAGELRAVGIATRFLPGTGLVADIGADVPAYRVLLRADLDALPVRERTHLSFCSTTPGVCHACGHDVHTAVVLGAGLALAEYAEELAARRVAVRLVFQAAEEIIPGGAVDAIAHGALDGVDAAFAVHCDPGLDVGTVGLREGPLTAACDHLRVVLRGHGGHTSRPYLTQDLTFALAKVVTEVPAALSRRMDPRAAATIVFGVVNAGKAANVIPSSGEVLGTLRMLDSTAWQSAGDLVHELVEEIVAPYAVQALVEYTKGVPPVVNAPAAVGALRAACGSAGAQVVPTAQSLGGEDFSWYLEEVPGAMARLGTRTPGGPVYDLHQGDLDIDEEAIGVGARLLASVVVHSAARAGFGAPLVEHTASDAPGAVA